MSKKQNSNTFIHCFASHPLIYVGVFCIPEVQGCVSECVCVCISYLFKKLFKIEKKYEKKSVSNFPDMKLIVFNF